MNSELLEIICCPETKQELLLAERDVVRKINRSIRDGAIKNRGGETVKERIDGGLIRKDGTVLYPIRKDIPILLIDESIKL
ncbi:Trm112 family protein [Chitinivibrio alkaliphilus]|uniref:Trm112 family protein n=1 Tax=Chitinivibrio alkaliphilus ACht1 TaxID=1313304 RepID=U7DAA9_9BACT|nr:Trm112 family protein [Chitinivibrio alkaliphilus]ERP39334.1 hypothetical protein CALK_0130 [Chitinivibrio alkaliphilus ACht1]